MILALFVGGPKDGERMLLPDDRLSLLVPLPARPRVTKAGLEPGRVQVVEYVRRDLPSEESNRADCLCYRYDVRA